MKNNSNRKTNGGAKGADVTIFSQKYYGEEKTERREKNQKE